MTSFLTTLHQDAIMTKHPLPIPLHDFPCPLITPRLFLRSPQPSDGAALHSAAIESKKEFDAFMPWAWETNATQENSELFACQAATNWIVKKNEEPWFQYLIIEKKTQQVVGICSLHTIDWDVPCFEIGYWLRTSKTGLGFMAEAVNALTRYAFDELYAQRIEIRCDKINQKSQGVPLRLGYQLEATLVSNRILPLTGQLSDTLIFVRHDASDLPTLTVYR
ncbi:TPA: GNAT family N-acetyltransferase [Candidatus Dependentiae bacterium]|nr:GNAT family N-acetyltransferase [Candidatus Dependentiae bacterium]